MELTPLSCALWLRGGVLFLRLWQVVLGHPALALSLVLQFGAELKASESDVCSNPESEIDNRNEKGKQIIDAEPSAIVATTKIQKNELDDPEEGERLFHS